MFESQFSNTTYRLLIVSNMREQNFSSFGQVVFQSYLKSSGEAVRRFKVNLTLEATKG